MNISHDGVTVHFKTAPKELFLAEKSGAKPNTVRILDNDEYEMINRHPPKKIGIRCQEEIFIRRLTNLHFAKLFGKVIVIFSWAHEEHKHSHVHTTSIGQLDLFENTPPGHLSLSFEQGDPNLELQQDVESPTETCQAVGEPPIDERFAVITISKGTLALLQSIAHGRTMNRVIKELYAAYIVKKSIEWGPLHD